jgi:hypothetical protein
MLRSINVNIAIKNGTQSYTFPNTSLGLLYTDIVVGIAVRTAGKSRNDKTLVNADQLGQTYLTLKEKGGKTIHQSLPFSYIVALTESDRFQMLPISESAEINWEESSIYSVANLTDNTDLELIIYYKAIEDC